MRAGTLDEAVAQAGDAAQSGEIVLLAPACSSFDQFENYEHRGRVFKDLVHGAQGTGCMAKRVGVDKWLFCVTLLLVVIGLVMVFSASAVMAKERFGSPYNFVLRQALWAALGLAAMTLLMQVDYRRYNNPNVVFPAIALTTILLLSAFLMRDSHNTHRWIKFGAFSFQPSEIAKPALVLFLAWFLQKRMALDRGLAKHPDSRGAAQPAFHPAHRERARPGHGAGVRRRDGADALSRGHGSQVPWLRCGSRDPGLVLPALPCGVAAPTGCWLS